MAHVPEAEVLDPARVEDVGPSRVEQLRARLLEPMPPDRLAGWLVPGIIAVLGGFLRFWQLARPHVLVFDETYYVKDGWSLVHHGVELSSALDAKKADALFAAGNTDIYTSTGAYVVHPPVGKWLIGLGELLFGAGSAVGWRFATALLGTVSILIIGRVGRRLFRSTTLGGIAAFLLAFEGLHLTMSRTGLLDIIVMFFALTAFAALLIDRDRSRALLAQRVGALPLGEHPAYGPWLGWRPWRWVAGLSLGLCLSTKWSGIFFIAVFGLTSVWWDLGARRTVGVRHWARTGLLLDGPYAAVQVVVLAAVAYPVSWLGWFLSNDGYLRHWASQNPGAGLQWLPPALRSWVYYHEQMWAFSTTLHTPHAYQSNPWGWLVQARPTSFFYQGPTQGQSGCTVTQCSQAITTIGTVPLWWGGTLALVVVLYHWVIRRDWRAGAVLSGIAAGYLPWFNWQARTVFSFYAVAFEPWVVLAVVFCIGLFLAGARDSVSRRWRVWSVAAFLLAQLAVFAWNLPIHTAQVIPYGQWLARMWFPSWI